MYCGNILNKLLILFFAAAMIFSPAEAAAECQTDDECTESSACDEWVECDDDAEEADCNVEEEASADVPYSTDNAQAQGVLDLVNKEREARGLSPLHLSQELMQAAAIRAEEITQEFSHTRPNGESCTDMIDNGRGSVGENIAAGVATPAAVVDMWMKSSGHRANILNPDYEELGVGYFKQDGSQYTHYWVQLFRGSGE